MINRLFNIIISLLICVLTVSSQQVAPLNDTRQADTNRIVAFVNVNVITMTSNRVLRGQTVIVQDGLIKRIGPTTMLKVPRGALRVDGTGKYLMPGLIDMHAHLFSDDTFSDELGADELRIMMANGVTTVRLMNGTPEQLVLREQIAKGELVGPTVFTASPQLTGKAQGAVFNGEPRFQKALDNENN